MPADPQRVQSVFLAVVDQPPAERGVLLDRECGSDLELRRRVETLLGAYDRPGSFLDSPPAELAATIDQPMAEGPGTVIGPYKLLQEIGAGGMGVVFMAEQTEPVERRVALKIIKPGMDTRQVIARFEAEEQALAMMDHPNIAKVLDAGTTGSGRPYFVMELVKGVPMTKYCDQHQLTPRQRLELFVPVCLAVQHAHQKGIIHRDLKPSNVLIALYDDRPVPKIIDFGVAKATSQKLTEKTMFTQFGQLVGTLEYMSPEQANLNQLDIDTRSDIYSLGVLLYELLTGVTPFDRQRLHSAAFEEMMRIIREEEPPKPSTRLSTLDTLPSVAANRHTEPKKLSMLVRGELDWIVMRALEKDRSRRYETANGLANDIRRYLNDEPVAACPPSAAYRFGKFARRNKVAIGTAALIALALILGLAGTSWQAVRAMRAERAAERNFAQEQQARQQTIAQRDRAVSAEESARQARDRAIEAEREATRQLFNASYAQAKASRWSGRSGQRLDSLTALAKSAELVPRLGLGHEELLGIRNEAIACMALVDLRVFKQWEALECPESIIDFSRDLRSYARADRQGNVSIRRVTDAQEVRRLSAGGRPFGLDFSPDGRWLAVRYVQANSNQLTVWEIAGGKAILNAPPCGKYCGAGFSPDSRRLAVAVADGSVRVFDVAAGKEATRITPAPAPGHLCFDPDGRRLGVSSEAGRTVQIWDLATGNILRTLSHPEGTMGMDWRADGKLLAVGGFHSRIYLWEADSGKLQRVLKGHRSTVPRVAFHPSENLLVSNAWDGTTRVWSLADGSQLLSVEGCFIRFDATGRYLAFADRLKIGLWELADRAVCQSLCGSAVPPEEILAVDFRPDGRLLASGPTVGAGARLWDVTTFREVALLPTGPSLAIGFHPADGSLIAGGKGRLFQWPIKHHEQDADVLRIGPPEGVGLPTGMVPSRVDFTADGSALAVGDFTGPRTVLLRPGVGKALVFEGMKRMAYVAITADGRWVATGNYQGNDVEVWNAQTGKRIRTLPVKGTALVAFSPDGQWLVTAATKYQFWRTGSWEPQQVLRGSTDLGGRMAFSPDGKVLAVTVSRNVVRLIETCTGRVLADLEPTPKPSRVQWICFSPDGSQLATACGNEGIQVWDLRRIRERLAAMQLDWDLPPYPPAVQAAGLKTLQAEVNLGSLVEDSS